MRLERAIWVASMALSACYFGTDKHEVDESAAEAGMGPDGSINTLDAAGIDARIVPSDAGDATVDAVVDAGCKADLECPLATPQCLNGACVPCAEQNDCARFADTPVCGPKGTCVVCTTDHDQLCPSAAPACDPNTNECVQCVADADCTSEGAAACSTNRSCGACTQDSQCTRFNKVCDTKGGSCVECRPETETMDCKNGTSCNPNTFKCGTRQRGSVALCNTCDADSECVSDSRCIPMMFGSSAVGNFCLKRAAPTCNRPYFSVITRASVNGVAAEGYCGVNETVTTCAAVQRFNEAKACTDDASCGVSGAVCDMVGPISNLCSYPCTFAAECYDGISCGGTKKHCGGS